MASLKEVRIRITSVSSTQQITKAMKMVSAAKLRRAQDAIVKMRPYASKLKEILENLSGSLDSEDVGPYSQVRAVNKVLIVAITSNRGLCGGFNANIMRAANRLITVDYVSQAKSGNVKILAIGKKASDFYSKNKNLYCGNHNTLYANLNFENTAEIAATIMKEFVDGAYDKVELIYNQFKNAAVQLVVVEQLLPIQPPAAKPGKKEAPVDYILEPSQLEIVEGLIPVSYTHLRAHET